MFHAVNIPNMVNNIDGMGDWLDILSGYGIDTIVFNPESCMDSLTSTSIYFDSAYGPTDEKLVSVIRNARSKGYKTILKPLIGIKTGEWRGDINPSNWSTWFGSLSTWLNNYAGICENEGVDIFMISTETKSSQSQEANWRNVVSDIRGIYSGSISYCASSDSYRSSAMPFWDVFDYGSLSLYPSLTNISNFVSLGQLRTAWAPWSGSLVAWQEEIGKPVIIGEFGCTPIRGGNQYPWLFDPGQLADKVIDYQEQADFIQTAIEIFEDIPNIDGMCLWSVNPYDIYGANVKEFNPFGHPGGEIIKYRWGSINPMWFT